MAAKWTVQAALLAIAATAQAQQGYRNYYGDPGSSSSDVSGSSSSSSDGSASSSSDGSGFNGNIGNFQNGPGFDIESAMRTRATHGILAAVAMVIMFPGGSMLMRIIPGRFAIWAHALMQMAALVVYTAAVGLGIHLVRQVRIPGRSGGDMFSDPSVSYHPIIGIVVLVSLFFQPVLGFIHHAKFKVIQRRQIWSYLHLFNGRIFITLGIANGGLGLWLAGASKTLKTAYIIVAAVMWALWMVAAAFGEWRRWRANRLGYPPRNKHIKDGDVAF